MTRKTARGADVGARAAERTISEVRHRLSLAFVHSLGANRTSMRVVAQEFGITRRTVQRWAEGSHRIDIERLMRSRLWPHFLRCLVIMERKARVI